VDGVERVSAAWLLEGEVMERNEVHRQILKIIEAAYMRGYRAHAAGLTADPSEAVRDLSRCPSLERDTEKLVEALREAIGWTYGEECTPERRDEIERLLAEFSSSTKRNTEKLVEALCEARQYIADYSPQDDAGFYDDVVQERLDQMDAALAEFSSSTKEQ